MAMSPVEQLRAIARFMAKLKAESERIEKEEREDGNAQRS